MYHFCFISQKPLSQDILLLRQFLKFFLGRYLFGLHLSKSAKNLYLHYKTHVTYKGLIGVPPSRSIAFVSELYDGSVSDKKIVINSGKSEKKLVSWDSVMVDRGFAMVIQT